MQVLEKFKSTALMLRGKRAAVRQTNFSNSLANYIFSRVFISYLIIVICGIGFQFYSGWQKARNDLDAELGNLSITIKPGAESAIWTLDKEYLQTLIDGLLNSPYVSGVEVYGSDGKVIAASGKHTTINKSDAFDETGPATVIELQRKTLGEIKVLGKLLIYPDSEKIWTELRQTAIKNLISAVASNIALWLIFVIVFRTRLIRRLNEVTEVLARTTPDHDSLKNIIALPQAKDEFGVLVKELGLTKGRIDQALSEAKSAKDDLERQLDEKNQLLRSLSLFAKSSTASNLVSTLAHEVNQPLAANAINVVHVQSLLEDKPNEIDLQNARDVLKHIRSDNRRAADVIGRLRELFISRWEDSEFFSLNDLIEESTEILKIEMSRHNIEYHLDFDTSDPNIRGERGQLQMVVFNALNNAIDALRLKIGPRFITVKTFRQDDRIVLQVQDNGPGIPEHILKNGFQLFQTTKQGGMGVGLWLSRAIVNHHGGEISAFNEVNGGARLVFSFVSTSAVKLSGS